MTDERCIPRGECLPQRKHLYAWNQRGRKEMDVNAVRTAGGIVFNAGVMMMLWMFEALCTDSGAGIAARIVNFSNISNISNVVSEIPTINIIEQGGVERSFGDTLHGGRPTGMCDAMQQAEKLRKQ